MYGHTSRQKKQKCKQKQQRGGGKWGCIIKVVGLSSQNNGSRLLEEEGQPVVAQQEFSMGEGS